PALVLALFSKRLADRQPDWPPQTVQTGFPFYDAAGRGLPPALAQFLDDGPPPIVFTLGWSAAMVADHFFEQSAAAANLLGRRAASAPRGWRCARGGPCWSCPIPTISRITPSASAAWASPGPWPPVATPRPASPPSCGTCSTNRYMANVRKRSARA